MRSVLRTLVGLVVSAATAGALAPRGVPALDPVLGPAVQAPTFTTFTLRLVAAGLCGYVALVLFAVLLAQLRVLPRALHRRVERWTGRGLAGGIRRLVGASALAAGLLPFAPTAAHAAEPPPPVMAPFDDPTPAPEPPTTSPPVLAPMDAPPTTTTEAPTTSTPGRPHHDPSPPATRSVHPSRLPPLPASTVTVGPGDSFWSIAEQLVALRNHRPPTDPEVIGPWLDLIAENRDVLPDPTDPDLLLPGTVLALPARRR
jgi:hypothetical protein